MNLLAIGLVLAGVCVLTLALFSVRDLVARLPTGGVRRKWHVLAMLIFLFIAGYAAYAAIRWRTPPSGASDFVVSAVFFLGACFVLVVGRLSLETAVDARRLSRLETENRTDPLTGMYNRRFLERRLKQEAARASRYDLPLSVLLLDIDHFKAINDTHGHAVGDAVLERLGRVTEAVLRDSDIAARYGGDEILVVLPNTRGPDAARLAERLRHDIEHAEFAPRRESDGGPSIRMTVSVGVASRSGPGRGEAALLKDADDALYVAKQEGRNRVRQSPPESGLEEA
jgi:diguanylate cyclase (GGDEF)-like protein